MRPAFSNYWSPFRNDEFLNQIMEILSAVSILLRDLITDENTVEGIAEELLSSLVSMYTFIMEFIILVQVLQLTYYPTNGIKKCPLKRSYFTPNRKDGFDPSVQSRFNNLILELAGSNTHESVDVAARCLAIVINEVIRLGFEPNSGTPEQEVKSDSSSQVGGLATVYSREPINSNFDTKMRRVKDWVAKLTLNSDSMTKTAKMNSENGVDLRYVPQEQCSICGSREHSRIFCNNVRRHDDDEDQNSHSLMQIN